MDKTKGLEAMRKETRRRMMFIFLIILLILAELFLLKFVNTFVDLQLNSDDSSELVLARLLAQEKRVLSPDWYYSTEIRFLNTNLIYTPFFRLFRSWHKIRVCSIAVMQILLIFSVFVLCRACRHTECFPFAALAMVLPLSYDYYNIVLKGAFYIPHIVILLLGTALILGAIHARGWKRLLCLALSFILAVLSGAGGPRQVVVQYLPLFFCGLILAIETVKKEGTAKFRKTPYFVLLYSALLAMIGSVIGYGINTHYLVKHYHFPLWDSVQYTRFDWSKFISVVDGILATYGFREGTVNAANTLSNLAAVILFAGSIAAVVYPLKHRGRVSFEYHFLAVFYLADILVFVLLYTMTSMSYLDRYNEPIVIVSYVLMAIGIRERGWPEEKQIFTGLVYAAVLLTGGGLVYLSMHDSLEKNGFQSGQMAMAHAIVEQGYREGYASFWNGNVLTELSDGAIDIHDWLDSQDGSPMQTLSNVNTTNHWLQLVSHDTEKPEGRTFILLSGSELENSFWRQNLEDRDLIYSSDAYKVYGFESYDAMIDQIGNYSFSFGDNRWMRNGHDEGDVRILDKGGVTFGPYMEFYKGDYQVTVQGKGLSVTDVSVTCDNGKKTIPIRKEMISDDRIRYSFHCDQDYANGETVLANQSDQDIAIDSIRIERISGRSAAP
jgi:hypothetical protein